MDITHLSWKILYVTGVKENKLGLCLSISFAGICGDPYEGFLKCWGS